MRLKQKDITRLIISNSQRGKGPSTYSIKRDKDLSIIKTQEHVVYSGIKIGWQKSERKKISGPSCNGCIS